MIMTLMPQTALVPAVWGMFVFPKEKNAMTTTYTPVLEAQDEDIQEVNPASAVLWRRLGLEALPDHETLLIPTERLVMAGGGPLPRSAQTPPERNQHPGIPPNPPGGVHAGIAKNHAPATPGVIARRRPRRAARPPA